MLSLLLIAPVVMHAVEDLNIWHTAALFDPLKMRSRPSLIRPMPGKVVIHLEGIFDPTAAHRHAVQI